VSNTPQTPSPPPAGNTCYRQVGIDLYQGDCGAVLARLPTASVQYVVTSPPYWGLRDYRRSSSPFPRGRERTVVSGRQAPCSPSAAEDYYGRVFIEVFESDSQVTIVGGDRSLLPRARTVLTGGYIPLRDSALPWTNEPATGKRANQAFLGRVVVEMWSNQAVVGITGADPRVVERATQRLMLL